MLHTREEALALLRQYNKESFHILHALTVEGVMAWYAGELGYGEQADFWALAGLLHDIDFEQWPDQHCQKAPELLREAGAGEELIHAVVSHACGLCSNVEPEHEMEKVLFAAAGMRGSVHNDPFIMEDGRVRTRTNHAGGVLGGITNGMPLVVNIAVKPTASISREQETVDMETGENAPLVIHGRHDPCIVPRAVPVAEAVAALTVLDMMLE